MRQQTEFTERDLIDPDGLPADGSQMSSETSESMKDTVLLSMTHVIMEKPDAVRTSCDVRETSELIRIHDRITVSSFATHVTEHVVDFSMNPLGFHVNHLDSPCSL